MAPGRTWIAAGIHLFGGRAFQVGLYGGYLFVRDADVGFLRTVRDDEGAAPDDEVVLAHGYSSRGS